MIRLILTFLLSALAFVSVGANDCVTPTQAYDSRGGLVWKKLPDVYGEVMGCCGDCTLVPFCYHGQYEDVETDDGTSLNVNGTIHDKHKGIPNPTKKQRDFLEEYGWKTD